MARATASWLIAATAMPTALTKCSSTTQPYLPRTCGRCSFTSATCERAVPRPSSGRAQASDSGAGMILANVYRHRAVQA